jgi:MFS family permease
MKTILAGRGALVARNGFVVYARLFDVPGTTGFVGAGFLARLTTSMIGLGMVLALTAGNHRYAVAGAIVSALVLANAMAFPVAGRLADRRGQDWVLLRLAGCFSVAMVAIIAVIAAHGPVWPLFPLGLLAGATMPVAAPLVRARWTALYQGTEYLRAAYGFETATTEVVFIVGPILVTMFAAAAGAPAGLIAALAFAVAGALGLAFQRSTQPVPVGAPGKRTTATLRRPAMRTLCLAQFGLGGVFGSVEIVTVAFATAHHARSLSGVLLGLWGLSSAITGLAYGAMTVRVGLHHRLTIAVTLFACGFVPLLFARGIVELAVFLLISGLTMAPATITVFEVVQRVVPASALTEAVSWAGSGVVLGMTAGSLVGGWAAEHLGIEHMYAIPVAYGALALTVIGIGYRGLRTGCEAAGREPEDTPAGTASKHSG